MGEGVLRNLVPLAATLSVIIAVSWYLGAGYQPFAIDWRVLHRVGGENYWEVYQNGGLSPFVYPPTALLLFRFLNPLEPFTGYLLWATTSIIAFFFACRAVWGWKIAALSLLAVASFQGLVLGQPSMLLSAIILFAFAMNRDAAKGLLLGLVLAIKPQLLVLTPLAFLVRRDWQILIWMGVSLVLLIVGSLLLFGFQAWVGWVKALPEFHHILIIEDILGATITPAGQAGWLGLPSLPFLVLGVAASCFAIIRFAPRAEGGYLAALVVAASLMASPYALPHDTMVIIPVCLVAISTLRDWRVVPALLIYLGWVIPLALFAVWVGSLRSSPNLDGSASQVA